MVVSWGAGAHLVRLQRYCRCLAEAAAASSSFAGQIDTIFVQMLECCAPLHDVGTVALPDHILHKPGRLDAEERMLMHSHTQLGAELLEKVLAKYGAGEAAVRAFEAGSDLLLMPADPDSAIASMLGAMQTGRITTARLDASVRRVLAIKRGLGLFQQRTVPLDAIARVVGSKAFQDAADDIAQRSLTLVRDSGDATETAPRSAVARRYADFSYRLTLPPDADPDSVDATMDHGLLTITVPRSRSTGSRRVSIGRRTIEGQPTAEA